MNTHGVEFENSSGETFAVQGDQGSCNALHEALRALINSDLTADANGSLDSPIKEVRSFRRIKPK